jgi:hypothetical protein
MAEIPNCFEVEVSTENLEFGEGWGEEVSNKIYEQVLAA